MFGKKRDANLTSVGVGAVFFGSIQSAGDIHVEGKIEGSVISMSAVSVGPQGIIVGDVKADSVTVGGRIEGTVVAQSRLYMMPGGIIKGDAHYGSLKVDDGGVIDGSTATLAGEKVDGLALPSGAAGPGVGEAETIELVPEASSSAGFTPVTPSVGSAPPPSPPFVAGPPFRSGGPSSAPAGSGGFPSRPMPPTPPYSNMKSPSTPPPAVKKSGTLPPPPPVPPDLDGGAGKGSDGDD